MHRTGRGRSGWDQNAMAMVYVIDLFFVGNATRIWLTEYGLHVYNDML